MGWPLTVATTSGWCGRLQPLASVRHMKLRGRRAKLGEVERRNGEGTAGLDAVGETSGTLSPSRGDLTRSASHRLGGWPGAASPSLSYFPVRLPVAALVGTRASRLGA